MCSISSLHSNWVYSSGWLSNLTFDQNEKPGIPFTPWQAGWYKSQPSQQGFFHRQWVVAVPQSSAPAIVRESFKFLKQAWAFYNSTKTKRGREFMVWLFEGQRRCFSFRSCICSALLWVGLCQCLLLIFCISGALKSPSWGSLTAFYTHTRLHIPQVRVHSLSPHCFIREKNLFFSHQLWKKALGCIRSGRGLYQTSSGADLGTQTV